MRTHYGITKHYQKKKSNGDIRYLALVRVSKNGSVVYNESRTFSKNVTTKAWGNKRLLDKHILLKRTKRNVLKVLLKYGKSKGLNTHAEILYTISSQHECPLDKRAISDVVLTNLRKQLLIKSLPMT